MHRTRKISFLFVLPALLGYCVIRVFPMLSSFYYSFTDWNGYRPDVNFIGLENYVKLFHDPDVRNSIIVSLVFVVASVAAINALAVLFAVLLKKAGGLIGLYRSAIFLPIVISPVAVSFIWRTMYSYDGLLNKTLLALQLSTEQVGWLTDKSLALTSVIIVNIWRSTGFHMVIILAALMTIPKDLYESSDIDGCNAWQKFRFVTLPLLVPGLTVSIVLATISSLKQYDLVAVLTGGGPVNATQILSIKIVQDAFQYNLNGYASAISFVLLFGILLAVVLQNMILRKKEVEY
ncbi:sugar ABC transporter permease [Paenibacillus sp.]|uniref:carbohydrate ABC transporter permease n=1 Tax=Paenibacillus sp. TaxID=58172 RepID=UPI002D5DDAC6|nr:sugar ABC transporter permease [Paenibacillus sp.]HZG55560.1 sugar ABC transporter permease [Paenibacillus sp.]